jgi:fructose-bisphosphate aldolase class I
MPELAFTPEGTNVMFKFTKPRVDHYYEDIMKDNHVVKVVALSGGYEREDACERLSRNKGMIASFSRALLEGLKVTDSEEEFDKKLADSIDMIYKASIS